MTFVNRVLAALLGLALLAGGLLIALEILLAGLQQEPVLMPWERWAETLRATAWTGTTVRTVCIILCLVGLALLIAELRPQRPRTLPLHVRDGSRAEIERRSFEGAVEAAAEEVDGVAGAKARSSRTAVSVTATTPRTETGDITEGVREAALDQISSLGLSPPPTVRVNVQNTGGGL